MSLSQSIAATRLIHENFSVIMTFAYSQRPLWEMLDSGFQGDWKYLRKALFDLSEVRANRALVELAMMIRIVDDDEDLAKSLQRTAGGIAFGELKKPDGSTEPLYARDLSNKIMHATRFEWDFPDNGALSVICHPLKPTRWVHARIDLRGLAALCGMLMS